MTKIFSALLLILCHMQVLAADETPLWLVRQHWGTVTLQGNLVSEPSYMTGTDEDIHFSMETIPYDVSLTKGYVFDCWWGSDGAIPHYIIKNVSLRGGALLQFNNLKLQGKLLNF